MESYQVDLDFAKAWDSSQGDFSKNLAQNIIKYIKENRIKVETALDICCGTSNYLSEIASEGILCTGTEIDKSMIDYSKEKCPNISYELTESIDEFKFKKKFDLITCNHDMINYLEDFKQWSNLFENAIKNLNKKGLFIFDFYTQNKLKDWNETSFSSTENLDCLLDVKSGLFDKTVLSYTYYINYQDYMLKTKSITTECYFETQTILDALKKVGFKNVVMVDASLNPLADPESAERIFVIAKRK